MGDTVKVTVTGLDETRASLRRFAAGADDMADDVGRAAAKLIAAGVRPRIPRRSGRLAGTLGISGSSVHIGGPRTPYAGWIIFGGVREGRGGGKVSRPYNPAGLIGMVAGERRREIDRLMIEGIDGLAHGSGLEIN